MAVVIVAIPEESDRVWKVSSEKVPHLTLLYLGEDADQIANFDQIVLFVKHAASTSLRRFYMSVDRRGELGEDGADVLFFKRNRYDTKAVWDFRSMLLKDPSIKKAYDATSQFETPAQVGAAGQPWIPHLTLGYSGAPAKSFETDDISMSRFYDVSFDRIAVWTGDYDGPEFTLKDYWEDFDMGDIPMDVAMGEISHYGVKGMRWGVRKEETDRGGHIRVSRASGRASLSTDAQFAVVGMSLVSLPLLPVLFLASPRLRSEWKAATDHNKLAKKDDKWRKAVAKAKKRSDVHNAAIKEINPKLKSFNKDQRWKNVNGTDIDLTRNQTKREQYDRAFENEIANPAYARAALKIHGANSPGGRYTLSIQNDKKGVLKIDDHLRKETTRGTVRHADGEDEDVVTVVFDIERNNLGHILGFIPEDRDGIQHSADEDAVQRTADLGAEWLAHYGVKGMRWGVRNAERNVPTTPRGRSVPAPVPVAPTATSVVPHGRKRKTKIEVEGGENHDATPDAIRVAEARAKLRKSGAAALSNGELREVANRLQLERQVKDLDFGTRRVGRGRNFVREATGYGRSVNEAVSVPMQTVRLARQFGGSN